MTPRRRWLRIALLIAGIGLFAYFIYNADPAKIRAAFLGEPWTDANANGLADPGEWHDTIANDRHDRGLGWLSLVVLVPYGVVFTIDTLGWTFTFGANVLRGISFARLWSIRLVGEAVNAVIPSMYVGGEAAKVVLLKRQSVPVLKATSAAVRSKTAQSIAQSTFIAMGAVAAFFVLPPEHAQVKWAFAGIALCGFTLMALLFKIQKHGMVGTLVSWVRRLGFSLKSLVDKEAKIRELDDEIYDFYNRDRKYFRRCTITYLIGWVVDTVEIMLVAHLLGYELAWLHAFAIEAFISVARGFNIVVPGSLGVQEFGIVGLFKLFGYPVELGMLYAIVRRGRDVAYAGLGWALLYWSEAGWARMQAEMVEADQTAGD